MAQYMCKVIATGAALHAVELASSLSASVQQEMCGIKIDKCDGSPVTIADYGAQILITMALLYHKRQDALPPFRMVAEEDAYLLRKPSSANQLARVLSLVNHHWKKASPVKN